MKHYIAILGAVREEIAGIKQRMHIEQNVVMEGSTLHLGDWEGYGIALLRTGIGRERARHALSTVCDRFPIVLIVSIGYAGGLDPDLAVGDLVVADRIVSLDPPTGEGEPRPMREATVPAALVNQAMLLACPKDTVLYRGALMTVDRVVVRPEEKQQLGRRYGALAVDMETSSLVQEADERGLPFLSVRSITDTAHQELIDCSDWVQPDGEVSKLKAGWHVLTHPGDLKSLIELRAHAQTATARLTEFIGQFLKNYPKEF